MVFKTRKDRAKASGVHVAMKGTIQGQSGWYQDYEGSAYYFTVDDKGQWKMVCDWFTWMKAQKRKEEEEIAAGKRKRRNSVVENHLLAASDTIQVRVLTDE